MTTYTVADGAVVRWSGGTLRAGSAVPPALLAEWGASGLQANVAAGAVIAHEPPAQRRASRKDPE